MNSLLPSPKISRLGFGCASIMGKVGAGPALSALALAFDRGVTHFDVARSYGFGRAERLLARFIAGRRHALTITSKFGVVPPQLGLRTRVMMPLARMASQALPGLRARLKNRAGALLAEKRFDADYARECLHTSLRELGTDYLDFYFLHEPARQDIVNADEVFAFLEDACAAGKIRQWGPAYAHPADHAWAAALPGSVIQFEGNPGTLADCAGVIPDARLRFVTRPFMGGGAVPISPEVRAVLLDFGASEQDYLLALAARLAGQGGCVICAMFRPDHIEANTRSLERFGGHAGMQALIDSLLSQMKGVL